MAAEEVGSGNRIQRQKEGPLELRRVKGKGNASGGEKGDGKGVGTVPKGRAHGVLHPEGL